MASLLQIAANVTIIEKSPKGKVNAICNEGSKTSSLMSKLSCSVPLLVVTMIQVIYIEIPTVAYVWKVYYKLRQM